MSHPPAYNLAMQCVLAADSSSGRRAGGLRQTISAYDAMAPQYAERFKSIALTSDRRQFVEALPLTGSTVLDAGCGHGRDCRLLESDGVRPVGLDLSAGLLRCAGQVTRAPLVRSDVRRLPFGDAVFDGVWCCAVLLHLDPGDLCLALGQFSRVIRRRGRLFVSVRHGEGEELRASSYGVARWFRFYKESEIAEALISEGFSLDTVETAPGIAGGIWVNVHAVKI